MTSWLGQYCINVTDLERSVAFYTALGLDCTSRTEIPQAFEAIVEHPGGGSKLQLAQQKEPADPFDLGTGLLEALREHPRHRRPPTPRRSPPAPPSSRRPSGWTAGRSPSPSCATATATWSSSSSGTRGPTTRPPGAPWLGQYCLNVTDIEATIAFYELLGLTCTSRTEIPHAHEAIVEQPGPRREAAARPAGRPGRADPHGLDVEALRQHRRLRRACTTPPSPPGTRRWSPPMRLDRWPVTIAFVGDPDGYQVELVQRHED